MAAFQRGIGLAEAARPATDGEHAHAGHAGAAARTPAEPARLRVLHPDQDRPQGPLTPGDPHHVHPDPSSLSTGPTEGSAPAG
ncbi:hypothetical protein GA0115258_116026 [Streptomyces sp. LamerLS-31b]|nr:hypothetical protein GA0115258_116026 [Streptomyces sp. LamerLS-31b]